VNRYTGLNRPFILSINVQSINAKLNALGKIVSGLVGKGICVDVIVMQEIWKIQYDSLITLPGYQRLVYKNRKSGKGGGVGFFIKEGLNYKIITPPFNHFEDRLFESLIIEISNKNNSKSVPYLIANIYRSPSPVPNMTPTEQIDSFLNRFDNMLTFLNTLKYKAYVCTDSNINLLDIQNNHVPLTYYNVATSNGFLLTNYRATRVHNDHYSLIDQIFTNHDNEIIHSGCIIEDISDHFPVFVQHYMTKGKAKPCNVPRRVMNLNNMTAFRDNLRNVQWDDVTSTDNVDRCYELFWSKFKSLYDEHFPVVKTRFNRNYHRIADFMTQGLIVSRRNKIELLKISVSNPTVTNCNNYKKYRNLYNKVLGARKKLYYHEKIENNQKTPKKCGRY
jgi:hypothetical protein